MQKPKPKLHPRNLHQGDYNLERLAQSLPELKQFIFINNYGRQTIDFADPLAVKSLNRALLIHFYKLKFWDIPEGFLCPPIPGRADYIHYAADLLAQSNSGKIPKGSKIKVLDIGTGANLIYPILGNFSYGWQMVGSEINSRAIRSAKEILHLNPHLAGEISIRKQNQSQQIFKGIIKPGEYFDLTICNPPFHQSAAEAKAGTQRKVKNLHGKTESTPILNFGGQADELWCEGGELGFIRKLIVESANFQTQVCWFTSLVSKSENLKLLQTALKKSGVSQISTIEMTQGNKVSRFIAWTFLDESQRDSWSNARWK